MSEICGTTQLGPPRWPFTSTAENRIPSKALRPFGPPPAPSCQWPRRLDDPARPSIPRRTPGAGGPPPPAGAACSPAARGGARSGQAPLLGGGTFFGRLISSLRILVVIGITERTCNL